MGWEAMKKAPTCAASHPQPLRRHTGPGGEQEDVLPTGNSRLPPWAAREGHHGFRLSLPSSEALFKTTPPKVLLSSIKRPSLPLFSGFAQGSPEFACPELQFLSYSQISSFAT